MLGAGLAALSSNEVLTAIYGDRSMPDEPLRAFSDHYALEEIAGSTPEEFANLEAAKELDHKRHEEIVDKILHRKPPVSASELVTTDDSNDAGLLHKVAAEERAEYSSEDDRIAGN